MSSTTRTNHQHRGIIQKSRSRSNQTKTVELAKKFPSHQPSSSLLPDEEFHSLHKAAAKNHSDLEVISPRKLARSESAERHSFITARNDDHHVIRTKAATAPMLRQSKPYRRSTCLEHMSAVNCTADCFRVEPFAGSMTPPAAPLPPRLPTPDLSDVDEDAYWSCCKPSESSKCSNVCYGRNDNNDDGVGVWDDMGKRLHTSPAQNDDTHHASRREIDESDDMAEERKTGSKNDFL